MWLKIISAVVSIAKATGLDKKVKGWVLKKLGKVEDKVVDKVIEIKDKIDSIKEKLEG
jgi:hypothetical protein